MAREGFSDLSSMISGLSRGHSDTALDEDDLDPDPIASFASWMRRALATESHFPNAVTLATATKNGRPSARVVLVKGFDERGFAFYSNYESRKGDELAANPHAALVFYWPVMERQVRVSGSVTRLSSEESAAYFGTRPHGSRLGAWASPQSRVIAGRAEIEAAVEELASRYPDEVPLPPHWGGYLLRPEEIEFWQGRSNRLHDRLRYRRMPDDAWKVERLAP